MQRISAAGLKILGIETSCDETGVAVYDSEAGLLGHQLYSQAEMHAEYGGVVPELASRDHVRKTLPLIAQLLDELGLRPADLDAVAYTAGPGLAGALLVGASVGHAMAWALGKPAIAVHHMEGHLLAPLLEDASLRWPFLALLVSGGHTQLIDVQGLGEYQLLGESIDDAVGEAFDKTAKLLGLGYPGGPALSRLAEKGRPGQYKFPRPMTDRPGLDFSFSGLKTFALNTIQSADISDEQVKADIALAFETAVAETMFIKVKRALKQSGQKTLVVAGGVSANTRLRTALLKLGQEMKVDVRFPRLEFCTDNGAMIAFAGFMRLQQASHEKAFTVKARWPMEELKASERGHTP